MCGGTFSINQSCIHLDGVGRLRPAAERYPSTAGANGGDATWKPFVDKVHAKGLAFGLHLVHGVPVPAVQSRLSIEGTTYTANEIVATPRCPAFIHNMLAINATHPGSQVQAAPSPGVQAPSLSATA